MLQLKVEPGSIGQVGDYLEMTRQRILAGVRIGMQEAMSALAGSVIENMVSAGVQTHKGELLAAIENSPKVTETPEYIKGTVSGDVGQKHVGLWIEEGIQDPAVAGKLYGFTEADGGTFYTRGHRAFDIKPRPFMNPALQSMKLPIMQIIQARVREAMES